MSNFNKKISRIARNRKKRIILALFITVVVSLVIVFIPLKMRSIAMENKESKIAEDTIQYNDIINRYNEIKKTVGESYYSDEEKAVIEEKSAEIDKLMNLENLTELSSKVDSLEGYISERNSTEMANVRNMYSGVLGMDISWLNDKEKEIIETAKSEFTAAFNSGDTKKITAESSELKKIEDEYKDLVYRRKYDSTSVQVTEPSYINGIMIVNKHFALPKTYNYGEDKEAKQALNTMIKAASKEGLSIRLVSGYRSYQEQVRIYASNVAQQGEYHASIYSARAGFSEHQSGLTFDLGGSVRSTDLLESFGDTKEGKWLADNAHKYGFIIRFLKDKEEITGYAYEPWHVRYVGVEHSTAIKESGQCLEEYLGLYPFE